MFEKVAFTAYPVEDIDRARKFYEGALGLAPGSAANHGGQWWVEYDLPGGGCLALQDFVGAPTAEGPAIALEVSDLEALVADLEGKGVTFMTRFVETPVCFMSVCRDSEGNALILHQLKRKR